MNAFPQDYVVHNLPLLLLSGLESGTIKDQDAIDPSKVLLREGGFRISTDLPPVSGDVATTLRDILLQSDASLAKWNGKAISAKVYGGGYRIRSVGRVGQILTFDTMSSACVEQSDIRLDIYPSSSQGSSTASFSQTESNLGRAPCSPRASLDNFAIDPKLSVVP